MANIVLCGGISWTGLFMRPVGVYQLANVLRSAGYTVQVIDSFPYIADRGVDICKKIFDKFVDKDTLWIGLSSTWFTRINDYTNYLKGDNPNFVVKSIGAGFVYRDAQTLIDNTFLFSDDEIQDLKSFIHDKSPNCKWVLGGGRAWLGRHSLRAGFIDCYIEGYADNTVLEYTKYLDGKNPFLPYKQNKDGSISIIHDHKAATFNYNQNKFSWHDSDLVYPGETLPMEIARGCIFSCSFCAYPLNGRKKLDYLKDPAILKEQFEENYERYKTTNYFFLDDTFNDSVEKLELLYEQVFSKLNFKVNFASYMRLDLINAHRDSINLLKEMGCRGMFFGIESLNNPSLKSIGKGITRDKIRETLSLIKENIPDAILESQFIVGLPYDSEETVRDWMQEVCDPSYPLDAVKIHGLSINPNKLGDNIWLSDFEKFPEKYGYTFLEGNRYHWINNKNLTTFRAWEIIQEIQPKINKKYYMSWLGNQGLKNLGASDDQIYKLSRTEIDILAKTLRRDWVSNYIEKLLSL